MHCIIETLVDIPLSPPRLLDDAAESLRSPEAPDFLAAKSITVARAPEKAVTRSNLALAALSVLPRSATGPGEIQQSRESCRRKKSLDCLHRNLHAPYRKALSPSSTPIEGILLLRCFDSRSKSNNQCFVKQYTATDLYMTAIGGFLCNKSCFRS